MNPSKYLKLAVVGLVVSASSAAAQDSVRQARQARIVKLAQIIGDFCGAAEGWKIAKLDPANGAWSDLQKADESPEAKKRRQALQAEDADMGNWKQHDKDSLRARVGQVREQCAAVQGPNGLTALLAKDAALEKIAEARWNHVTEKLDEVALQYEGKNSMPSESTNKHYRNFYGHGKAVKGYGQADRINQLTSDSVQQLLEIVERGELAKAAEAAGGAGAKAAEAARGAGAKAAPVKQVVDAEMPEILKKK